MKSGESITSVDIDDASRFPCYGGNGLRGFTHRFTHSGRFALIGRQGALCGNVVGVSGQFFASEHAVVVTAFRQTDIGWLTYVLGRMRLNQYSESSAQPGLSVAKLLLLDVACPPTKAEQRAIAAALTDMDDLIGSLKALIAKKRAIKKATMQQLLAGRTRLPGFGGEWATKRLGELGEISGVGVDKKRRSGEVPVRLLNYLDVYHRTFVRSRDLSQAVSAPDRQAIRCRIERGDVFFTPTSEVPDDIGRAALAVEDVGDGVYSYHVVRFRLHAEWDLRFRAFAFDSYAFRAQTRNAAEGSGTRYVITLPRFRTLQVSYPVSLPEQRAIAAVLTDMDAEVAALERRLDKTRQLKQGMMQQLLTGSIRLPIPDAVAKDEPGR